MTAALRTTGLACGYDGESLLSGVDLEVQRGELVALVGVNGSGKSTLLRTIVQLLDPLAGSVEIDGADVARMPSRQRARRVAYVDQEGELVEEFRVDELVGLGRIPYRAPWSLGAEEADREAVAQALAAVELTHAGSRACRELSGGERRRTLLARGLAQESNLLILDEPTNHLDVRHQGRLLDVVRRSGRTVLAAIHDLSVAATYFDRVVVLHHGSVHAIGTAREVLTGDVVDTIFGVSAVWLTDPNTGNEHLVLGPGLPSAKRSERPARSSTKSSAPSATRSPAPEAPGSPPPKGLTR